ncbi:wax ester/triacylglycerol synthase family O-acyltransferase [Massilia arenosa]|uniref:diacylglycerol O-acyltransferase n=1 Tax=Zemynaea arenosa TaxID=2561931 RepID=A0A4Y9SJY2_9BURK|nr:wax ester/triacylglycerol synthase family O-acyltransferase [Massilia arenosa]TFW23014.1 wax ester/triacylglycerol synthase family O-acyltransferase [Massilia arenosa]
MDFLNGLDSAFLHFESPAMPLHVGALHLLELPEERRAGYFDALKLHLAGRVRGLPAFGRKLAAMPFGVANPVWVEDASLDVSNHLRRARVAAPGGMRELEQLVAELHAQPLDRGRALWELHLIEGLAEGGLAVYLKVHHAALDGQGAAAVAEMLMDATPDAAASAASQAAGSGHATGSAHGADGAAPSAATLLTAAVRHSISQTFDLARRVPESLRAAASMRHARPSLAPRTPLNATITPERDFATLRLPLDEMSRAGKAFGGSTNVALLGVVSGAMRRYLNGLGKLPDSSLVAGVAVNLRERGDGRVNNQAGMWFVPLATDEVDIAERMRIIADNAQQMRDGVARARPLLLTDFPSFGVPWVMGGMSAMLNHARLADTLPPMANLVVSNVTGPMGALYLAGAKVTSVYPISVVAHGLALNVTAFSYGDALDIGVTAAKSALPDLQRFMDCLRESHVELLAVARTQPREATKPPGTIHASHGEGAEHAAASQDGRSQGAEVHARSAARPRGMGGPANAHANDGNGHARPGSTAHVNLSGAAHAIDGALEAADGLLSTAAAAVRSAVNGVSNLVAGAAHAAAGEAEKAVEAVEEAVHEEMSPRKPRHRTAAAGAVSAHTASRLRSRRAVTTAGVDASPEASTPATHTSRVGRTRASGEA